MTAVDPTTTGRVLEGAAMPVRPAATRRRRGRKGASDLSLRGRCCATPCSRSLPS